MVSPRPALRRLGRSTFRHRTQARHYGQGRLTMNEMIRSILKGTEGLQPKPEEKKKLEPEPEPTKDLSEIDRSRGRISVDQIFETVNGARPSDEVKKDEK